MKIFIAGICGVFMAGIAQLAREIGHEVVGCDDNIYPPMSDLLAEIGVEVLPGYAREHLLGDEDLILLGNALSRGNPIVESVLNQRLAHQSGAAWLHDNILRARAPIAVAGTHGKTTTAAMLAWILRAAKREPGYLIGGRPGNFATSAQLGRGEHFVIEADEYDTAFFDKRAKFTHYAPRIAVLHNLEFDHADIYADIAQIQTQFHHLVRIVPGDGCVALNADDARLKEVMQRGCWSRVVEYSIKSRDCEWFAESLTPDCSRFALYQNARAVGEVQMRGFGEHNMQNALAAIVAAGECDVDVAHACDALQTFEHAARRLQVLHADARVTLYWDFAHHPTAIAKTIAALRARHPRANLIVGVEPRSNSMRMRAHGDAVERAMQGADHALLYADTDAETFMRDVTSRCGGDDVIVLMSNGGFDQIPMQLAESLRAQG